jgi:anti-sigma factor RsiW
MNTNPDEATLALWLDDELTGSELAAVEAWAAGQPEQLAAREEVRRWRKMIALAVPASEEPPFPDFFNSRIQQAIQAPPTAKSTAAPAKERSIWRSWLLPLTACAGMALAFWVGKQSQAVPEYDVSNAPRAIPVEPMVYTPETGVKAEWFASSKASATVIVLNGVTAIPDSTDFSETVYLPTDREIDSTADSEIQPLEVGP